MPFAVRVHSLLIVAAGVSALAACRRPERTQRPSRPIDVACAIEPTNVRCTVTNHDADRRVACLSAYVGVKRSAALITPARRECSSLAGSGGVEVFDMLPGLRPRETCGEDLSGCELLVIDDAAEKATIAKVIAFVRELEARAPDKGREHPTLDECEAARRAWVGRDGLDSLENLLTNPELTAVFCIQLDRAQFDCLRTAKDVDEMDRCPGKAPSRTMGGDGAGAKGNLPQATTREP